VGGLLRSAGRRRTTPRGEAARADLAELDNLELIGCYVLPGRWTFQAINGYHALFREVERSVRHQSEMKQCAELTAHTKPKAR
jgi:hypothetical protein